MSRIKTVITFVFFFFLVFLGSVFGTKYLMSKKNSTQSLAEEVVTIKRSTDQNQKSQNSQSTTQSNKVIQEQEFSQIAPNGEKLLTLNVSQNSYNLYVEILELENKKTSKKLIYTGQLDSNEIVEIPFNTWSPDNSYFFIKKTVANSPNFLVFKANGEKFADSQFVNVSELFIANEFTNKLKNVTGWASKAYLLVQTTNPNTNSDGLSMWFNVYNLKFIQLSSIF